MRRVQEVLQRVHDNGYVYKGLYEGWYCPRCADFKVENEILEGNLCPIHEIPLTRESEENWFFRLSAFQARDRAAVRGAPDFVMPESLQRGARVPRVRAAGRSLTRGQLTLGGDGARGTRGTSSTSGSTRC